MNILHVSLGLPPLRSGGLTRYSTELMKAQVDRNNVVSLLYPGRSKRGPVRVVESEWYGVKTYELINPLPVALTYGVGEPLDFIRPCNCPDVFSNLLQQVAPDVIHVHSIMGIYREFFLVANRLCIPIVFTTHDYYPMCPRCTFINSAGMDCPDGPSGEACLKCCAGGMTRTKSEIMQSRIYALVKGSRLFNFFARHVKNRMLPCETKGSQGTYSNSDVSNYEKLLEYNKSIFEQFDLVLSNSSCAESIYIKSFPRAVYRLARISHSGLARKSICYDGIGCNKKLKIGYFGGKKEYKGFGTLIEAAYLLDKSNFSFTLNLYGDDYGDISTIPHAVSYGRVEADRVGEILRGLDVVIVPSKYHETFGFIVLEALSEGTYVISSDVVGASDLLDKSALFAAGDSAALADILLSFECGNLPKQELPYDYPLSMEEQVLELASCYKSAKEVRYKCKTTSQ